MVRHNSERWTFTGSSVSGDGYGYGIYRDDAAFGIRHAVNLRFGARTILVPVESFREASDMGQAFCRACHAWNVAQKRERLLAQGYALIG